MHALYKQDVSQANPIHVCSFIIRLVNKYQLDSLYGPFVVTISQCSTNGFTEVSSLSTNEAVIIRPGASDLLYLFFSVNFTSDVKVSSFTLLAQPNDRLINNPLSNSYPELQIWREVYSPFSNAYNYNRMYAISGTNSEVTAMTAINSTLYQYKPTSGPITVQCGDILGLLVPIQFNAIILPFFRNNNAPSHYERTANTLTTSVIIWKSGDQNIHNRYSPLVAVEIGKLLAVHSCVVLFIFP